MVANQWAGFGPNRVMRRSIAWRFVGSACETTRWWPGVALPVGPAEVAMAVHAAKQVVTRHRRSAAFPGDPKVRDGSL